MGELRRYEVEERPGVVSVLKLTEEDAARLGAKPVGESSSSSSDDEAAPKARVVPNKARRASANKG